MRESIRPGPPLMGGVWLRPRGLSRLGQATDAPSPKQVEAARDLLQSPASCDVDRRDRLQVRLQVESESCLSPFRGRPGLAGRCGWTDRTRIAVPDLAAIQATPSTRLFRHYKFDSISFR